ncbi:cytochrome P450 [Auriculariales sp. MPI-PUGE-AT-0066]|nr:cytochrome P450 [Auriculariales sp. MPI-PUGE-AT-0066]
MEHLAAAWSSIPSAAQVGALLAGLPTIAVALNVARQKLLPKDPSLPPEVFHFIPLFGSAASYGEDPIGFLAECQKKYGDCFTFVMLGRKMTVCTGAKGSNLILGGSLSQVSAEEAYKHLTTPVFGTGVVYDCPNHVFMEQKRFIKSGLSNRNFEKYVEQLEDEVLSFLRTDDRFSAYQKNDDDPTMWGSFHSFDAMCEVTILTACRTLQGDVIRGSMDKTFAQRYLDLDGGFTPLNFMFPNLPLPSYWRRDRAQKEMSDFYVNIVRKRKAESVEHDYDMMAALMGESYKDGSTLPDRQVANIMIALLMAGQHTSSSTSAWALLHLAERSDIADELYREQVETFGKPDGTFREPTYGELRKLPYSMPSSGRPFRKVVSDIPVPPTLAAPSEDKTYVIPSGHYVLASPAVSQVDPRIWKQPQSWDPHRWSDPAVAAHYTLYYGGGEQVDFGFGVVSKGTESPYQPFGAGRHRCVGEQFAYLQLGMIIAVFVREVEMRLPHKFPAHNYHTMIVTPKNPCNIEYRRRRKA